MDRSPFWVRRARAVLKAKIPSNYRNINPLPQTAFSFVPVEDKTMVIRRLVKELRLLRWLVKKYYK